MNLDRYLESVVDATGKRQQLSSVTRALQSVTQVPAQSKVIERVSREAAEDLTELFASRIPQAVDYDVNYNDAGISDLRKSVVERVEYLLKLASSVGATTKQLAQMGKSQPIAEAAASEGVIDFAGLAESFLQPYSDLKGNIQNVSDEQRQSLAELVQRMGASAPRIEFPSTVQEATESFIASRLKLIDDQFSKTQVQVDLGRDPYIPQGVDLKPFAERVKSRLTTLLKSAAESGASFRDLHDLASQQVLGQLALPEFPDHKQLLDKVSRGFQPVTAAAEQEPTVPASSERTKQVQNVLQKTLDSIQWPQIDVPDIRVPEIQIPEPAVHVGRVPQINVPQIEIPEPTVHVGRVPQINVPQIEIPEPTVHVGRVPQINVPQIEIPEPTVHVGRVPQINVPQIEIPEPTVHVGRVPQINVPQIEIPEPTVHVGRVPQITIDVPEPQIDTKPSLWRRFKSSVQDRWNSLFGTGEEPEQESGPSVVMQTMQTLTVNPEVRVVQPTVTVRPNAEVVQPTVTIRPRVVLNDVVESVSRQESAAEDRPQQQQQQIPQRPQDREDDRWTTKLTRWWRGEQVQRENPDVHIRPDVTVEQPTVKIRPNVQVDDVPQQTPERRTNERPGQSQEGVRFPRFGPFNTGDLNFSLRGVAKSVLTMALSVPRALTRAVAPLFGGRTQRSQADGTRREPSPPTRPRNVSSALEFIQDVSSVRGGQRLARAARAARLASRVVRRPRIRRFLQRTARRSAAFGGRLLSRVTGGRVSSATGARVITRLAGGAMQLAGGPVGIAIGAALIAFQALRNLSDRIDAYRATQQVKLEPLSASMITDRAITNMQEMQRKMRLATEVAPEARVISLQERDLAESKWIREASWTEHAFNARASGPGSFFHNFETKFSDFHNTMLHWFGLLSEHGEKLRQERIDRQKLQEEQKEALAAGNQKLAADLQQEINKLKPPGGTGITDATSWLSFKTNLHTAAVAAARRMP